MSATTRTGEDGPPGPDQVVHVALDRAPPHRLRTHARATVLLVVLAVVVSGVAYPWVMTEIAQVLSPQSATGSLISHNGTIIGSSLVAQNLSHLNLFWARPSMNDYNTTLGYEEPYGPSDPALLAYLNETIAYMVADWNWSMNTTLPFDLVSPSYSGLDPYEVPAGVLIQVPRVAGAIHNDTGGSFDSLVTNVTGLVNRYTEPALGRLIGVPIVNVMLLDLALVESPWWG